MFLTALFLISQLFSNVFYFSESDDSANARLFSKYIKDMCWKKVIGIEGNLFIKIT